MRRSTYFVQFEAPPDAVPAFESLGAAQLAEQTASAVRLQVGSNAVEVTALADDLFRVGLFGGGQPCNYRSEAVPDVAWSTAEARIAVDTHEVRVETSRATARVTLDPLRITFQDPEREFACDDEQLGMGFIPVAPAAAGVVDPLGSPAIVYKRHVPGTHYFGCGERTGGLDKTQSRQIFWNFDPPTQHTAALNNMYTSVPFVLAVHDGRAWGMFVDSSYRLEFDLVNEDPHRCGFAVDGGPLIYYLFAGPTPRAVLERYTQLTGRIPLPPRWALGNHQSRWGYKTADQLVAVARKFRERRIPLDAVYLDIDYMDGYRVFTWDGQRFPDPADLVHQLGEIGVKLITILDPGVKVDERYRPYREGRDADLFCRTFLGQEYRNVVWPGLCAFPDFTNQRTRDWWGAQLAALLDVGVAGIWCDMNEPTVFVPTPQTLPADVAHHGEGSAVLHAQVHNLYGQLMARATHEGFRKLRPAQRPLVISRAGFAGLQRYALHWTGDNTSWWEHLWMSMPQLQNLGLSGYAWVGVDIGGFSGDATGELLARWTEFGIFQPFCRNHSAWNTRPQEPWAFGEPYESQIRSMLLLRQRLIPYLYTLFEEAHRTGAPILRALLFEYPDDPATYTTDDEFLVGRALLVAPIARPGVEYRHVYLPGGTWVHFWSGERLRGPAHVLAHAPLGRPAIYVRANTPIPLWPEMAYDGERQPDPLTWLVFVVPSGEGSAELYEDEGDGYGYERGSYARTQVRCSTASEVELIFDAPEGGFAPPSQTLEVDLRGLERPSEVTLDGSATRAWDYADGRLTVRFARTRDARRLVVRSATA